MEAEAASTAAVVLAVGAEASMVAEAVKELWR